MTTLGVVCWLFLSVVDGERIWNAGVDLSQTKTYIAGDILFRKGYNAFKHTEVSAYRVARKIVLSHTSV